MSDKPNKLLQKLNKSNTDVLDYAINQLNTSTENKNIYTKTKTFPLKMLPTEWKELTIYCLQNDITKEVFIKNAIKQAMSNNK